MFVTLPVYRAPKSEDESYPGDYVTDRTGKKYYYGEKTGNYNLNIDQIVYMDRRGFYTSKGDRYRIVTTKEVLWVDRESLEKIWKNVQHI